MPLTKTVPLITENAVPLASQMSALSEAVDEILTARLSGLTWLALRSAPQLELGDIFGFGTITNLSRQPSQYSEVEFPVAPTGGQVLSYSSASKYVAVTGVPDFGIKTLNRKYYSWRSPLESAPGKWWAKYDQYERFEKFGVADIIIENYTDPTAGNNTTFTWKSHWDRYGCIRIHNGNKFPITWTDGTNSQEIPAFGIKCARRLTPEAPFTWSNNYIHTTYVNDETTWDAEQPGQVAACMDRITDIVAGLYNYCRFNASPDSDSTTREKVSFSNTDILGSDYVYDWIYHRGDVLSVVTEITSGTSSIQNLTWNGLSTGFTPTGHVSTTVDAPYVVRLTSQHSNPDWIHHLIPKSTNIIGSVVDVTYSPHDIYYPSLRAWGHLSRPMNNGAIRKTTGTYKKPYIPYSTTTQYNSFYFAPLSTAVDSWTDTVSQVFPFDPSTTGTTYLNGGVNKVSDAIGRWSETQINPNIEMVGLEREIIDTANFSGSRIVLKAATHFGLHCSRRRFIARQARRYSDAGYIYNDEAVYDSHPQDHEVSGSLDQKASDLSVRLADIKDSLFQFEGTDWLTQRPVEGEKTSLIGSGVGTWLHTPLSNIHYILENISTPGWWYKNYVDMINGTGQPVWKLRTWRIPRLIEEYNDLAMCVNNVKEVVPVGLEDLWKDPLPAGMRVKPWKFYPGEYGYTVPYDWVTGYNNTDNRYTAWCTKWGVTARNIDLSPYRQQLRYVLRNKYDFKLRPEHNTEETSSFFIQHELVPLTAVDLQGNFADDYVNGQTYVRKFAIRSSQHERILFGSAGDLSKYRYNTKTDLETAFSFVPTLNVGYRDVGYRYNPTIEIAPSTTLRVGTIYGDSDYPAPVESGFWTDAQAYYRLPHVSGDWVETFEHTDRCRLMDKDDGSEITIRWVQKDPTIEVSISPNYNLVHDIDFSANARKYGELPDGKIRFTSFSPNKLLPVDSQGYKGWRNAPSLIADYPITIICSAEPYYRHDYVVPWDEAYTGDSPDVYSDVNVSSVPIYVRTVPANFPITVDQINTWSGQSLDCWHVQIIKHTGVLRE
jgi:hypothetical protein